MALGLKSLQVLGNCPGTGTPVLGNCPGTGHPTRPTALPRSLGYKVRGTIFSPGLLFSRLRYARPVHAARRFCGFSGGHSPRFTLRAGGSAACGFRPSLARRGGRSARRLRHCTPRRHPRVRRLRGASGRRGPSAAAREGPLLRSVYLLRCALRPRPPRRGRAGRVLQARVPLLRGGRWSLLRGACATRRTLVVSSARPPLGRALWHCVWALRPP